MSTTTDQKLTRSEVIAEAKALGFTQIQTYHGWQLLDEWFPYGQLEPRLIRFYLATINDQPYICERQVLGVPGILSTWPIA